MQIQYAVRSRVGSKRDINEDSYRIESCEKKHLSSNSFFSLFAVADGMGGHPCGEVASKMACEAFRGFLRAHAKSPEKCLQHELRKTFNFIDDQIRQGSVEMPACLHMGTTLSILLIFDKKAVIAHIGDTRIYCLHKGKLNLLTIDHTFIQEMLEKKLFTPAMAASSPHRNILTQVLGTDEQIEEVYVRELEIASGDRFLLSSDGLHDSVSFEELELMISQKGDPEETVRRLMSRAVANGGQDDITFIVVDTA